VEGSIVQRQEGSDAGHDPPVSLRAGTAAAVALGVVAGALLVAMASRPTREALEGIDEAWLRWMIQARWASVVAVSRVFNVVGSGLVLWPIRVAVAGWLGLRQRWQGLAVWVAATVTSEVAVVVLKALYGRERPPDSLVATDGFAFPSGHTTAITVVVVGLVIVLLPPGRGRLVGGVGAAVMAACMGLSRTVLAAHWLSDAYTGAILGATMTLGAAAAVQSWWMRRVVPSTAVERAPRERGHWSAEE